MASRAARGRPMCGGRAAARPRGGPAAPAAMPLHRPHLRIQLSLADGVDRVGRGVGASVHGRDQQQRRVAHQVVRPQHNLLDLGAHPGPQARRSGRRLRDGLVHRHDERRGGEGGQKARREVHRDVGGQGDRRRLSWRSGRRGLATHGRSALGPTAFGAMNSHSPGRWWRGGALDRRGHKGNRC